MLAALALALCSLALGFVAHGALGLDALSGMLTLSDLWSGVLVLLGGTVLAAGLARDLPRTSAGTRPIALARG